MLFVICFPQKQTGEIKYRGLISEGGGGGAPKVKGKGEGRGDGG